MTTRLMALVMLPVTVMCLLAGSVVLSHRSLSSDAIAVNHGVVELSRLVRLRGGLRAQESVATFDVRFAQLGVTRSIASDFLGFDIAAQVGPARVEVAEAIDALGSDSPVAASALRSLYAEIDSGAIDPTAVVQRLRAQIATTGAAAKDLLGVLDVEGKPAQLGAALESVRAAGDMIDVAAPQVFDLSVVWFPSPTDTPTSTSAALARFSTESALYASAAAQIRELGVTLLSRIEAEPSIGAFDQAVNATLLGRPLTQTSLTLNALDTQTVTAAFRGYFARDAMLDELAATAATAVSDQAVHIARTEHNGFIVWSVGATLLALASIGIALSFARALGEYGSVVFISGNIPMQSRSPSLVRSRSPFETWRATRTR